MAIVDNIHTQLTILGYRSIFYHTSVGDIHIMAIDSAALMDSLLQGIQIKTKPLPMPHLKKMQKRLKARLQRDLSRASQKSQKNKDTKRASTKAVQNAATKKTSTKDIIRM